MLVMTEGRRASHWLHCNGHTGVLYFKLRAYSCVNEREERCIMIEVGKQAPDFELASHLGGTKFTLSQFKGQKNVMLVFYPLDWTPT